MPYSGVLYPCLFFSGYSGHLKYWSGLKILHINASYKPAFIYGGPTMAVSMLCEQLTRSGTAVTVFTTTANGSKELKVATDVVQDVDGVAVIYFKTRWK